MKLLDTNGLDHMVKQKIVSDEALLVTPDIQEEFETWHEQRVPKNVANVFEADWFDNAEYLKRYKEMLNKYGGRSFYNMTGFGDISVLAFLKVQETASTGVLFPDDIEVISNDNGLAKRIRKEFGSASGSFGARIKITSPVTFFGK
jgi:hypothetical protein